MEPVPFGRYSWPTIHVPLASIGIRIDELAKRLNLPLHKWDQDGLGPTLGLGGRLSSGRSFELQELHFAVQYHGAKGRCVFVDASDLTAVGVEKLLDEILKELHLLRSDVTWALDRDGEEWTAALLRDFRAQSS